MKTKNREMVSILLQAFTVLVVFLTILQTLQLITKGILEVRIRKKYPTQPYEAKRNEEEQREWRIYRSDEKFLPDGTLHLIYRTSPGMPDSRSTVEIYDRHDKLIWTGLEEDIPFPYLKSADIMDTIQYRYWGYLHTGPDFSRDLIFPVVTSKGQILQLWRYDFAKGYFTGYDTEKNILGYCCAAGFTDTQGNLYPFAHLNNISPWIPESSHSPQALLLTDQQLYQADFENRSLEKLYESRDSKIRQVQMIDWRQLADTDPDATPVILVHIEDHEPVLILKDPHRVIPIQIPDASPENQDKFFFLNSSGRSFYLTAHWTKNAPPKTDRKRYRAWLEENRYKSKEECLELYQIDESGVLTRLTEFEYTRPAYQPNPSQVLQTKKIEGMQGYATLSAPVCFAWMHYAAAWWIDKRSESFYRPSLLHEFHDFLKETRPWAPRFYYPTSLLLTLIAFLHALPRRTGWGKVSAWLVFVFCFNLAGFLTYLSLNHYPVIRCASCGRRRGLNRPDCPSCGAGLPTPEARDVDLIYPPSGETPAPA